MGRIGVDPGPGKVVGLQYFLSPVTDVLREVEIQSRIVILETRLPSREDDGLLLLASLDDETDLIPSEIPESKSHADRSQAQLANHRAWPRISIRFRARCATRLRGRNGYDILLNVPLSHEVHIPERYKEYEYVEVEL